MSECPCQCPECVERKRQAEVIEIFVSDVMRDGGQALLIRGERATEDEDDG